jgi:ribosomal protein S18 acetylase RimI-like enzyme
MSPALRPLSSIEARQLDPLLTHEADVWLRQLGWEHSPPAQVMASAARRGTVGGQALVEDGRLLAYAYYVLQTGKAVVGGAHGLPGSERISGVRRVLEASLDELMQDPRTPRIESQLIYFGSEQPERVFEGRGFQRFERAFLAAELDTLHHRLASSAPPPAERLPLNRRHLEEAARTVHASFLGSPEREMSDCYQSIANCRTFLESIASRHACGELIPRASFLVRKDREPAGVIVTTRIGPLAAHVVQVSVWPTAQRVGLGTRLLAGAVSSLREAGYKRLTLSVSLHNRVAHRWYLQLGYALVKSFSAFAWSRPESPDDARRSTRQNRRVGQDAHAS